MKYTSLVHIQHKHGEKITIQVSGKTADKVSYVASRIRDTFEEACVSTHASTTLPSVSKFNAILSEIRDAFNIFKNRK